jgi:hypothetical protein
LKSPKTAKGTFGKVWRFQAKNLEMFGVDLEKFGRPERTRLSGAMGRAPLFAFPSREIGRPA